jgi:hypothetical protein
VWVSAADSTSGTLALRDSPIGSGAKRSGTTTGQAGELRAQLLQPLALALDDSRRGALDEAGIAKQAL